MIITLKGCTATAFIGGLNFYKISKGTVSGSTVTINASTINKDEATSTSARDIATVSLNSGYENLVVTVTMGGATVNWYADGKVTIPANTAVTGDIKISASATAVSGGDVVEPEPEEPGTGGGSGTTTSIRVTDFSDAYRAMVNATTGEYKSQSYNESYGGSQVINKYDIPSGATQVNYQVFKTGGGYGSGFEDSNGNWISGYANTDEDLMRYTLDIPSNASKFVFMYMDNGYADYQGKPRFDYIEFLGVFEGSGESGDSGNTESVKSYTYNTDVRGLLDTTNGTLSSVPDSGNGTQVINEHIIPSGATQVKYQVFKTGKTYGSGFADSNGNWISGYAANQGETTGNWKTLSIPSNATVFKHMYPDSNYIKTMTGYNSDYDFQYVEFLFN